MREMERNPGELIAVHAARLKDTLTAAKFVNATNGYPYPDRLYNAPYLEPAISEVSNIIAQLNRMNPVNVLAFTHEQNPNTGIIPLMGAVSLRTGLNLRGVLEFPPFISVPPRVLPETPHISGNAVLLSTSRFPHFPDEAKRALAQKGIDVTASIRLGSAWVEDRYKPRVFISVK